MVFNDTYIPRITDRGRDGKLLPGAVLCIMEDLAYRHCAAADDDVLKNSLAGVAWICLNWRIGIRGAAPEDGRLDVSTWSRKRAGLTTVLREFSVRDAAGNDIIAAEARFALWDIKAGTPVKITDELIAAYRSEDRPVFQDEIKRLIPPEEYSSSASVALRGSDIDYNGHVHNTRYLDIASEGAGGFFDFWGAKEINIAYRKPVEEGDRVSVSRAETAAGRFFSINNQDGPCCFIELKM